MCIRDSKYGALSGDTGKVGISWTVAPAGEELAIELSWREQHGPPVAPPQRRGFGSRLLAASARQIKGEFEMAFPPTGLVCRIRFIVPRFLPDSEWSART